jgi:PKD repeat protein
MARAKMAKGLVNRIVLLFILLPLLSSLFFLQTSNVKGAGTRTLNIQDAATGLNYVNLGNESEPLPRGGINFTVRIYLSGTIDDLFSYQIGVTFNNTLVKCTRVWAPTNDPSFVFYGQDFYQFVSIDNTGTRAPPLGVGGIALASPTNPGVRAENGILYMMDFTALRRGNATLSVYEPTFADSNQYTFFMTKYGDIVITNTDYTSESFTATINSAKSPPVSSFTFRPPSPKANQTIVFDASSSYDPDGEIVSYIWDFGDNATQTTNVTVVSHAYIKNGLYLVNLTLVDTDSLNNTLSQAILVGSPPIANFTYSVVNPPYIYPGDVVTFNATESIATNNGTLDLYTWYFGDGANTTSANATATHAYLSRGVYNVTLIVTDNDGLTNSTVREIAIGIPPSVTFTFEPTAPMVDDNVTFTATVTTETNVTIVYFVWDFGDGLTPITTNTSTATHAYHAQETYNATVTVYDQDGLHGSFTSQVPVTFVAVAGATDWTWYIVVPIIIVVIVALIVIRRRRSREEEESIDL